MIPESLMKDFENKIHNKRLKRIERFNRGEIKGLFY